jgi:hypothetical protein
MVKKAYPYTMGWVKKETTLYQPVLDTPYFKKRVPLLFLTLNQTSTF